MMEIYGTTFAVEPNDDLATKNSENYRKFAKSRFPQLQTAVTFCLFGFGQNPSTILKNRSSASQRGVKDFLTPRELGERIFQTLTAKSEIIVSIGEMGVAMIAVLIIDYLEM